MSEMIERVAEAISASINLRHKPTDAALARYARAAIEAMREPTPEIDRAMRSAFERQKPIWPAAIDAALGKVDA